MSPTKVFPSVPAKVYSTVEVNEFAEAIKLGAGRVITWQTPNGQVIAKIKHESRGMESKLHYDVQGQKIGVAELIGKLNQSGVEYKVDALLTDSDYVYV